MLHISIKPEIVFYFQGFPITNSLLTSYMVVLIMLALGFYFTAHVASTTSKFVFFIRFILIKLHEMFQQILGAMYDKAFPLIISLFFFILLSNWIGLLPGMGSITVRSADEFVPLLRGATADLNTTFALALISFVAIQYYGFSTLGMEYLKKFINLTNPINFLIGILEVVSEFSKILSFAFRLFGNIFAGEVLLSVMAFLIPVLASFPFLVLEVFVGIIQALVFSMLTAVFISSATASHAAHN